MADNSINLRTLKKNDDNIEEILMSVTQVAVYNYDRSSGEWARKEIEGPLFFVRRKGPHEYGFFVINRLNTTNLSQQITADFETYISPPFLMYKSPDNEIYCIWFYDRSKLNLLHNEICKVIEQLKQGNLLMQNNLNGNQDLLNILGKLGNAVNDGNVSNNGQTEAEGVTPAKHRKAVDLDNLFNNTPQQQTPGGDANVSKPLPKANLIGQVNNSISINKDDVSKLVPGLNGLNLHKVSSFLKTEKKGSITKKQRPANAETVIPSPPASSTMNNSIITAFSSKLAAAGNVSKSSPAYLTMEQLKQSLIYLLQNDADFLHIIHSTYVSMIKK